MAKDTLANTVNLSQELIRCCECGVRIDPKFRSYFSMSGANGQKIYFCSVCYRDMACTVCGKKLGLKSFIISECPNCNKLTIECRDCVADRIKAQKNIPSWQKVRLRGLKKRSRALIEASIISELE